MRFMDIFLVFLAFVLLVFGLVGAIAPVIPGPPLSFIGLLLLQFSGHADFSAVFLGAWAAIAAVVTVVDYLLPAVITRRSGGSRAASIGSLLGLLAGMFLFPPFGVILGPFFGAFIGELLNRNNTGNALKVAFGAFVAFMIGTGVKLVVSGLMLFYAIRVFL
jgi:uncharacterized protein YqgC (DUF456 family)